MIYLTELILNLTLLVALTVVSGFVRKRWGGNACLGQLLQGVLFGSAAVIGMLHPLNFSPGVIFDGRSVMISLCALFFGPWAAAMASAMTILVRIGLGGTGTLMGVLVILSSAGIGLLARSRFNPAFKTPSVRRLYLFGLVVHLTMLALMFTLPEGVGLLVVKNIGLPVLLLYPLATILAGKILSDQLETERTMAMLQASRTRLIEAQHIAKTGDFTWDVKTGEVTWSDGLFDLLQYEKSEKIDYAKVNAEIHHPEDLERVTKWLGDCIASGMKDLTPNEYRLIRKNGTVIYVHTAGVLKYEQGKYPKVFATVQDITERKRAEEEKEKLEEKLRQAYKMDALGTLTGGIAHDFNNLLAIIVGYSELIRSDSSDESNVQECIKQVELAAHRATDLVRQILAFSRQTGNELIPVRLQSLVKESIKLLRATIPTTIEIIQDIHPQCGVVNADPTQINQIMINLCTNAVHAMDEKGVLEVALQEVDLKPEALIDRPGFSPGPYVCLSVLDTGAGMDKKTIDRIFNPFFTTKDVGKGTGMGLSVVHGLVESHGGFVTVESEPGKGSTFNVFLPVTEKEEFFEVETTEPIQTGNERILVVDDEPNLTALARRILENLSYKVVSESSSTKALEIFKSNPEQFDLVITDQSMPDMSGSELIAEVLKIRPDIPCILCTGFSSKVSAKTASDYGISKYINKPYSKKLLAETVREVLDAKL